MASSSIISNVVWCAVVPPLSHIRIWGMGMERIQAESWKWCRTVTLCDGVRYIAWGEPMHYSDYCTEGRRRVENSHVPTVPFEMGGVRGRLGWSGWQRRVRQLAPFDLGQSIDRRCSCRRQRSGRWVRGWAKVSHCDLMPCPFWNGKLSRIQWLKRWEADRDALVVSHLEKLEHWEGWRNAGRDAGMLHMCRDDTEHGTMWRCQYQLFWRFIF